jgi:Domain of unknown function (DUF6531)
VSEGHRAVEQRNHPSAGGKRRTSADHHAPRASDFERDCYRRRTAEQYAHDNLEHALRTGPVTFDDANQPATAATFNIPGTYVLQLSAFDGALTTNATVTVTVNANTSNLTTGWIQSPVNNAAVSGQVPITLISGITLVSGTLTYFPATNPQGVVTLNASTTGSGPIGTFDATLLANGGYFIILNGTNSQNVTQTSQVYVTSVGDYKPGRVTATITDLTVPAPGLPIQIQRTYDSLVRGTSSDFGYGWTLGVNIQTQIRAFASCAIDVSMALFTWAVASHRLGLMRAILYPALFTLLAVHAGTRARREALKLQGTHPS